MEVLPGLPAESKNLPERLTSYNILLFISMELDGMVIANDCSPNLKVETNEVKLPSRAVDLEIT